MNTILRILINSLPLLFASTGALISEYTGVMAIFTDGIINLSSFLAFACSVRTGSAAAGCILAALISALFIILAALFTEKTKANPFITGIGVNLLTGGLISLCSASWFGTKGVLSQATIPDTAGWPPFAFSGASVQFAGTPALLISAAVIATLFLALNNSRWGLRTRVTGSSAAVLSARGVNPAFYRICAWGIAGVCSAWAGILCTLRLSSFVPNVSAGRGWIALAAVFLGRRTMAGTILAAITFTAAEYAVNSISAGGSVISPTMLLAIPYLAALLLFTIIPQKHAGSKKAGRNASNRLSSK